MMQSSGEFRREKANACPLHVIARSEATRQSEPRVTLDCFAYARNDGARCSGLEPKCLHIESNYFPVHTGLRFSPNAFRPSFASSVIASSAIWLSV